MQHVYWQLSLETVALDWDNYYIDIEGIAQNIHGMQKGSIFRKE